MILDQLIKDNAYPIVFVGSGISKRYLKDFPNWEELLEKYWDITEPGTNFYSYLNTIRDSLDKEKLSKEELNYYANIQAADNIEQKYKELFFAEKIQDIDLKLKDAYHYGISPFKKAISEQFSTYEQNERYSSELELWKEFIRKAQIIITTNYDTFIEDTFNTDYEGNIKVYVGQEGFFDSTDGWAELFKIHGSITNPNSIVINTEDYKKFDHNSILISAKIISSMVTSPIIFLGYSMQDVNVRKILSDFSSQLPNEDARKSASRIIVVEWEKGEKELKEEIISDPAIGAHYTLIRTDNFSVIFEKLSKINQGLTPYEIRRYQNVIKKLVISEGQKGSLDAVLLSPQDLNEIEDKIQQGKPIVVALGDKRFIYMMPTMENYLKDYIFQEGNIMPEVALRFIGKEVPSARTPFIRHLKNCNFDRINLLPEEKERIKQKILRHGNLDNIINSVNNSNKIICNSLEEILENDGYNTSKKLEVIVFNIRRLDKNELDSFIKERAYPLFIAQKKNKSGIRTAIRKLFMGFDLIINGDYHF